ncbi:MAG: hypothetical protein A4E19_05315 [Nitrospira sp. SG-bin1]|nr:MAG: hypothetical protein A4E19_05315 [Nitrospira sp. SG-bin1]
MKPTSPINLRIEWCQRQSAQANTESEGDGWRAEADGLQDALLNCDHTDNYRLCPPEILRRYVLGFRDGTALLQATRLQHATHAEVTGTPQAAPQRGGTFLQGDD